MTVLFEFAGLHVARPDYELPHLTKAMVDLEARFEVRIMGQLLYAEPEFTVVEFAAAASRWLREDSVVGNDFEFRTVDADDLRLWFRNQGDTWRVGSIHEAYEETSTFSLSDIEAAINRYLAALVPACQELGFDITPLLA